MKNVSFAFRLRHIIIISLIIGCTSVKEPDPIQELINQTKDENLKQDLIEFQKGGVYREVNLDDYDVEELIVYAQSFINTPHLMGGTCKEGMDCSGLLVVCHKEYGIDLPHSSQEQARYGIVIPNQKDLIAGDLVFFRKSYKTSNFITHTGIYLGDGEFIHTSNSKGVIISNINDPYYWGERYLFATRLDRRN